ncbi:glycosyltransferase 87 family protein [Nocardia sp. NBC_01503]|uniref:glycosyltransferase family 87 protein n=1 Tax=Nocardia sp. NBC_01503 TaxID=2975997 RepID=UPI002E7B6BF5|nr:glycosyltransferase 87 family protein [Nocardia sp. NBC_01503]WTL36244.1 glycosyltransferase 87 family protein [Nocardia sp. NBC_01503]
MRYVSPAPLAADLRSVDDRDKPSRTDTLTAQLCDLIGGPVGDHALIGRVRFWTPMRVLMAFAVLFLALSWFGKAGCIQQAPDGGGGIGLDWNNGRQYVAMCYSDTVPLYGAEHLNEGAFPYKKQWTDFGSDGKPETRYMEYPVLSGLYQYGAMGIAKAWKQSPLPGALEVVIYFNVVAVGLALAWLVTIWAAAQLAGRRVWDAALMALSPLVLVHAFTNFDTLATAFAACGLLAWARKRPVLAGVLLGLGGAAKLYPLLLLGPIVVLCLRAERLDEDESRWGGVRPLRAAGATVAGAAITWLAVNAPIAVLYGRGWREFFRLNTERHADPDSVYNVFTSFTGWRGFDGVLKSTDTPALLNLVSLLLFVAACAGIGWIGLTAARRPRLAQLAFLVVAAFLLTNKVWSPQYSLWLVPLAVLALPQRRILLAWMTIDALVWVPRMYYYLGTDKKGIPEQWFTGTVALRDITVIILCALVIRQIYCPGDDPVRRDGVDDPGGGILDRAPDPAHPWLPPLLRPRPALTGR